MKLKTLTIQNLRNVEELSIPCDRGIHFIHGMNGQGKTTLLESIYLLSNLRSFRDSDPHALLRRGSLSGSVKGTFSLGPQTEAELRVDLIEGPSRFEKRAYINQKLSRSAVEYFGLKSRKSPISFHVINLNPASTDLIRADPAYRRTYLNQVISSEEPEFLDVLKQYQKTLDQKNALLKQDSPLDVALLRILNESLARAGARIQERRIRYLQKLAPETTRFLAEIAPDQAPLNWGYKSGETLYFNGHFDSLSIEILEENLHRLFDQKETLERIRKTSLIGPHRDDWVIRVDAGGPNPELVDVGSQGEIRSALLALRLAELEGFEKSTGVRPVLLIDDFSSELDSIRRKFLLGFLKDSDLQIFVTSTDDLTNSLEFNGTLIRMDRGRILR